MGHHICAVIGNKKKIKEIAEKYKRNIIELEQNFAMIFITDDFYDELSNIFNVSNKNDSNEFFFDSLIKEFLKFNSFKSQLGYIETDYFGGNGYQAAALAENGKVSSLSTHNSYDIEKSRPINDILRKLGVKNIKYDEFETLGLENYRIMDEDY